MHSFKSMKLALGTVQFGRVYGIANKVGQVNLAEIKSMLSLAGAHGINVLDTAIAYGDAEKCLGEVGAQEFKLVTKLPGLPENCDDVYRWVKDQVDGSLSRLKVKKTYGMLLHKPEQLLGNNGPALISALKALKENGEVEKIGVSIYSPDELEALTTKYKFDLVQAPFNILDRRLQSSGWMSRLKDSGVEIHTRSTFLQGLLLMQPVDIPHAFAHWDSLWHIWHRWLENNSTSALEACLAFVASFNEIDKVIVGADSHSQLVQILKSLDTKILGDFPKIECTDENLINPSNWLRI